MSDQPAPQLWQTVQPVDLVPANPDKTQQQSIQIAARQGAGFPVAGGQIAHAIESRATHMMLDFTAQACGVNYQIDGQWEALPPLPRDVSDAMLFALKQLAEMNPADRRSPQQGKMKTKVNKDKYLIRIQSQGSPNGERAMVRIEPENSPFKKLSELGMRDKMVETTKELLNKEGSFAIVSAPKSGGLTTTWEVCMESADRLIRDFQALEPEGSTEPEIININPQYYGQEISASDLLRKIILKEPDVFVLPVIPSAETLQTILEQITKNDKAVFTRVNAGSCIEALVQVLQQYPEQADAIIDSTSMVLNQRLVRRLCENCRQAFQPPPQLLAQLRIPPGRVQFLYQPFVMPPIEQQVDANGNPAPIQPCGHCSGRSYK
ncbi:MAG: ATPase, T2SS/T4P/T4SS family, partial [Planctomycetota bacterium]